MYDHMSGTLLGGNGKRKPEEMFKWTKSVLIILYAY